MPTEGRVAVSMRLIYDETRKHLRAGLSHDQARTRAYELRDLLCLNLADLEVESALWIAIQELEPLL